MTLKGGNRRIIVFVALSMPPTFPGRTGTPGERSVVLPDSLNICGQVAGVFRPRRAMKMVWASCIPTLIGLMMVMQGRQLDLATPNRLEEQEGPAVVVGLGILCLFLGAALGIVTAIHFVS